ncbi:hypothetical protein GX51_02486 [Blastomyces parvus]|uniref:HNH nuclease domain-containing protein n=1 Tax=Blastomyces parvus TaxID=2060905 RepID=A0A2B7XBL8_9EURO|nr:hypothetical protein GX51_02486 [Blastomyces parvus]
MSMGRASFRNVHFYNALTGECLGGFYQKGSLTEETMIRILTNILLIVEQPFTSSTECQIGLLPLQKAQLSLGIMTYLPPLVHLGRIHLNEEPWVARLISYSASDREDQFRSAIRARDRKCVISGRVNNLIQLDMWPAFHAAHVFPLECEGVWREFNYGRWITNMDDAVGISKINSTQNGLLMDASLHNVFDQYLFSIDPDDDYKLISFFPDDMTIDGRILDPVCRDPTDPNCVSDELLRWHFRQSVLANMRGAGEPVFESDFPAGTDRMATLREESYGKERFKIEINSRLRPVD